MLDSAGRRHRLLRLLDLYGALLTEHQRRIPRPWLIIASSALSSSSGWASVSMNVPVDASLRSWSRSATSSGSSLIGFTRNCAGSEILNRRNTRVEAIARNGRIGE